MAEGLGDALVSRL